MVAAHGKTDAHIGLLSEYGSMASYQLVLHLATSSLREALGSLTCERGNAAPDIGARLLKIAPFRSNNRLDRWESDWLGLLHRSAGYAKVRRCHAT